MGATEDAARGREQRGPAAQTVFRQTLLGREQGLYVQVEIHTIAGAAAVAVGADRRPPVALEQAVEAARRRPGSIR
jgi:hypothetical protein